MQTRLSSSLTFFHKFVFPTIWILGFTFGTVFVLIEEGVIGLFFLAGLIFGTALMYYISFRAKKVYIDDEYLYVDNFRRSIRVPLSGISRVYENVFFTPRPIFIEFKNETVFGKKIMFIGYSEPFLFFFSHPAVKLLRKKIKSSSLRFNEV